MAQTCLLILGLIVPLLANEVADAPEAPHEEIDLEVYWNMNGTLVHYLNESTYDELVVDPVTNKLRSSKPWLILMYKADCKFC